ncbi:MAG TPA: ribonuclease III [Verrucomicrobiales bacterium]|nr:ribonuclease III [Verrucomicrobiales bacterium]
MHNSLADLEASLGYRFKDPTLLRTALTHPSLAYDAGARVAHNQRLEFLGDAVLELALTHELFRKFPDLGEGPLTKARAQFVNKRTLAEESRRLRLGEHLQLSHGEEQSGGRDKQSALADVFEAVVGAIFLDGGFDAASGFVNRCFQETFGELTDLPSLDNPKGELQEMLQIGAAEPPHYEITSISGPDHDREFACVVYHRNRQLGAGRGKSKKAAESAAALDALAALRRDVNLPGSEAAPGSAT